MTHVLADQVRNTNVVAARSSCIDLACRHFFFANLVHLQSSTSDPPHPPENQSVARKCPQFAFGLAVGAGTRSTRSVTDACSIGGSAALQHRDAALVCFGSRVSISPRPRRRRYRRNAPKPDLNSTPWCIPAEEACITRRQKGWRVSAGPILFPDVPRSGSPVHP